MKEAATACAPAVPVERLEVRAYQVPTDGPGGVESDGTLTWHDTTCVVVPVSGGGQAGIGYTYGDIAVAHLIDSALASLAVGADALTPAPTWLAMFARLRNAGRPGIGAMAVSAVDIALWDLRAAARPPALPDLARVPQPGAGLRQRRIHQLPAGPAGRPARRLGRAGHRAGQDEDLPASGGGPGASGHGVQGHRRRAAAVDRRQRSLRPQAGARLGLAVPRGVRRVLAGGAGVLRGRDRPGPDAHPGPAWNGHRSRGVRVRAGRLRPPARGGRGRLPAGRRHPVRRHHRAAPGDGAGRRPPGRHVRALRPRSLRARVLRRRTPAAPGVLPRPRADRVDALRRHAVPGRRGAAAGSVPAWAWSCAPPTRSAIRSTTAPTPQPSPRIRTGTSARAASTAGTASTCAPRRRRAAAGRAAGPPVRAGADAGDARVQAHLGPGREDEPGQGRRPLPAGREPQARHRVQPAAAGGQVRLPRGRRRLRARRAALRGGGQVPGAAGPGDHVPVLPRNPGGEVHHPGPGPAAIRDAAGRGHRRRLAVPRGLRRPRPVPGLQGLHQRLPGQRRHADLQGRVPPPPLQVGGAGAPGTRTRSASSTRPRGPPP